MICQRIKSIREQNQMTQSELAKRLGITRSSVNAWEMGISVPSTQYIVQLAELFKVTTDYILELDNDIRVSIGHLSDIKKELVYNLIEVLSQ